MATSVKKYSLFESVKSSFEKLGTTVVSGLKCGTR
jgi:hypothetical protein